MSNLKISPENYIRYGLKVSAKELSKKEWRSIIHDVCHGITYSILRDLTSVSADNKVLSHSDLWDEEFTYDTSGDGIPSAKPSGKNDVSPNVMLVPLVRLRLGEYKISYLLISPDGFQKWVKCTQRIRREPYYRYIKVTKHPLSFDWMSNDELLTFIMKDSNIGLRLLAAFNRLINKKILEEQQRVTKYLLRFERVGKSIVEIQSRISL